jgi:hypothetical protein
LELPRSIIHHAACCAQTFTDTINTIIGPAHYIDLGGENRLLPLAFDPIALMPTKTSLWLVLRQAPSVATGTDMRGRFCPLLPVVRALWLFSTIPAS